MTPAIRSRLPQPVRVGEDLVDLARTARSESQQRRFDARAFSRLEQDRIEHSADHAQARWRYWSAKEAAFKAAFKGSPGLVFNPLRFEVLASPGELSGVVVHQAFRARVGWTAHRDYIHCVALIGVGKRTSIRSQVIHDPGFGDSPRRESTAARTLAHSMLADQVSSPFELVHGESGNGPLLIRGDGADLAAWDLSVSHDGVFVSATICMTQQAEPGRTWPMTPERAHAIR